MERYKRGQPFNMRTPQNVRNAIKGGKNMKFVGGRFKTVTPKAKTPTPKKAVNMYINKFVNKLDKDEVNALKKKICQP